MKYDQHLHVVTESKMDSEPKYKRGSKQESESPITILIQKNQTAFVTFKNNHFKNDFSAADTKPNLLLQEPTFVHLFTWLGIGNQRQKTTISFKFVCVFLS